MKSTRFIVLALFVLTTVCVQADGIRIEPFTLAANEEMDIEILLDNNTDYGGLQFDLYLPDGVSIVEDEYGFYYENTERLKYKKGRNTVDFNMTVELQTDGGYRFLIYNSDGQNISGLSGEAILTVRLTANDHVRSSTQQIRVKQQVLSTVDAEETTVPDSSFPFSLTVRAKVGTLGYATFSWPVALDFTGLSVTAFIATERSNGSLHLEPVEKVPAGTGLILKGEQGTYTLQTTYEEGEDVSSNLLLGTADGDMTVQSDDVYVLANKNEGLGFYRAANGLLIYQYKAYLQSASGVRAMFFDETPTGISAVSEETESPIYTLEGLRVKTPTRTGLYIKGGKVVVVKCGKK